MENNIYLQKIEVLINQTEKYIPENVVFANIFGMFIDIFKDKFVSSLGTGFEDISMDLDSMSKNPNCSCRKRVFEYTLDNQEKSKQSVKTWCDTVLTAGTEEDMNNIERGITWVSNQLLGAVSNEIIESSSLAGVDEFKSIRGKVFTINNTPEEFYLLISELDKRKMFFNNFSVLSGEDGKIKVFFV